MCSMPPPPTQHLGLVDTKHSLAGYHGNKVVCHFDTASAVLLVGESCGGMAGHPMGVATVPSGWSLLIDLRNWVPMELLTPTLLRFRLGGCTNGIVATPICIGGVTN